MGYIPDNAEWYLAELAMEITVHGARSNVLHRNLILIHAHSPEEAYDKAVLKGQSEETDYKNPKDQAVEIRFRGISSLNVVYEPLVDGAELCFVEQQGVSESEIQRMIPPEKKLDVFIPPTTATRPDQTLILRSFAAVPLKIPMRSPSSRPGMARIRSTGVRFHSVG